MDGRQKVLEIDKRLVKAFSMKLPQERRDVIHELVHAVLSQNTSRGNYDLAYARLMEEFPTVEELAAAPTGRIEKAIRPGGLSRQKSAAIKDILSRIEDERGDLSLEFARDMTVERARAWLTSLPGVGPKTASVVLMFAAGRKVLPVDTHVLRTSKRTGLIDGKVTAEQAQALLEEIVPPAIRPRMHLNLVELGREICHARGPAHEICPVNMLCDFYRGGES
jgi:endonuclease-3